MPSEIDGSPFKTGTESEIWNTDELLKWTNEVRLCLGTGCSLSDEQVEAMSTILKRLLDDEKRDNPPSLVFIAKTRLDLLIRELLNFGNTHRSQRTNIQSMEMQCFALQRVWRKHFKLSSFVSLIEEERQRRMEEVLLRDVELDHKEGRWVVEDAKPESYSQGEGSLAFEPGQWWLNLACCYRDGMVGHVEDDMTKGPYGVTALPLLVGEELESSVPECFIYRRTGPIQDMYVSIMSELGRRNVRILRGHKLNSPYAPKGGIRYDGLYTPIEYHHKLNIATNMYEVELTFKRNWGTPTVETLLIIPTPSQLDEWKLYLVTAANEREINRPPNRIRLTPQGNEPRSSALLASPEFREALRTESPSSLKAPESPPPTQTPTKKPESGPVMASTELQEMKNEDETEKPSPPMPTPTQSPSPSRGRPRKKKILTGTEDRGMRTSDLIDMLNEGPDDTPPPSVKVSPAPQPPSKSLARGRKMTPQGSEDRGMRSSDLISMLNEGPDEASSPSPVEASPEPRTPSKSPPSRNRKKMIAQDNEERGSFMKSSDFMDMLNEGPDEASAKTPAPSTKSSRASAKKATPTSTKPSSVRGKSGIRDSAIVMDDDNVSRKSKADEPPVVVKKRGKAKDPYDIDEMMNEIEKEEEARIAAEEEEERSRSPNRG